MTEFPLNEDYPEEEYPIHSGEMTKKEEENDYVEDFKDWIGETDEQ